MKEYLSVLKTAGLFENIGDDELKNMLGCIGAETDVIKKGEIILLAGDKPQYVGIALSGQLHIIREDYDGNRSLMAVIYPGEIFAEALCCAGVAESPVTVMAGVDCAVMRIKFSHILNTCPNSCSFHTKLIENMLGLIAKKNLLLQSRMEIIGLKSVRAKVMRYLESFAQKQGREITIPLSREELANFLCVERSALSHELARMKNDGLIEYKKNKFRLNYSNANELPE